MMQFFGTIVTKEDPVNLELDEGDIFHLTQALIHPNSTGKGKVYVTAIISLIDEDDMSEDEEEENEEPREDEIEIPICVLENGKTEQVALDLHYNFEQIVRFELRGQSTEGYVIALSGTVITMEQQGGCDDEDCDEDHLGHVNHEDDEELDSDDEEFDMGSDDVDGDDDSDEEVIPQLIPTKKQNAKITEVKQEAVKPQQSSPKQAAKPQQSPKQQPNKANNQPDKAAINKPQAAPAKPQATQSKNAPKQPQQQAAKQSPAKPEQNNNKKRPQNQQNENNKKKSKK